ncbi:MAG: hypothetical protein WAP91_00355 [Bacilli bacterium]
MSGQDLYLELSIKVELLDKALRALGERGREYAKAEHDYRVALAQKILIERDRGTPVTIISDVCRGDKVIAKLKFERDVAEVVYKAAMEAINTYKLQIKILENQIEREWKA